MKKFIFLLLFPLFSHSMLFPGHPELSDRISFLLIKSPDVNVLLAQPETIDLCLDILEKEDNPKVMFLLASGLEEIESHNFCYDCPSQYVMHLFHTAFDALFSMIDQDPEAALILYAFKKGHICKRLREWFIFANRISSEKLHDTYPDNFWCQMAPIAERTPIEKMIPIIRAHITLEHPFITYLEKGTSLCSELSKNYDIDLPIYKVILRKVIKRLKIKHIFKR